MQRKHLDLEKLVRSLKRLSGKGVASSHLIVKYTVESREHCAAEITMKVAHAPRTITDVILSWLPEQSFFCITALVDLGRESETDERYDLIVWIANDQNLSDDYRCGRVAIAYDEDSKKIIAHLSCTLHIPEPLRQQPQLDQWLVPLVEATYRQLCVEAMDVLYSILNAEEKKAKTESDSLTDEVHLPNSHLLH